MTITIPRQLNELALAAGRKRQSKQTGFVHCFYQEADLEPQHTIPVVENALFILALLKTKTSEHMSEAKELLDKLLWFQNQVDGNFPIYIHEYPECKDRMIGSHLLPIFYYMLQDFQSILGSELKHRLISSIKKLLDYSWASYQEKLPSYTLGLKLAASTKALGTFFNHSELEKKGSALAEEYFQQGFQPAWCSPASLGDICIALQLLNENLLQSTWGNFTHHLIYTWHQKTKTYIGPVVRGHQYTDQPQGTLYDLFLGYLSDGFSSRALDEAPYHLQATLIRTTNDRIPFIAYPYRLEGFIGNHRWSIYQEAALAYSFLDIKALSNPAQAHTFHPFYMVWGDRDKVHTFVCQGGNFDGVDFEENQNQLEMSFHLSEKFEIEDREKARELIFYFDIQPDLNLSIHGEKATTFHLSEEFIISTPQIKISFQAFLEKGIGEFIGHKMKGNRPAQTKLKGADRFNAYDWQLFLRTLRRQGPCTLKVLLRIDPCL